MEYWPDGTTEGNKVPEWKALWSPSETYVRYASGEHEFYGPDDPWQLSNRYKDGLVGNEPADEAILDQLILQQSACRGSDCL